MKEEQKELLGRAEGAIIVLKTLHKDLLKKHGKTDWTLTVGSAIKAFEKMKEEWLLAIGHPQSISNQTLKEIVDATSRIIKHRIDDGTF